jgi:uncharacterized protein
MEFHIHAYDGKDDGAKKRRLKARSHHLEVMRQLQANGHFVSAGAILNDAGDMIGSTLHLDFPSRAEGE